MIECELRTIACVVTLGFLVTGGISAQETKTTRNVTPAAKVGAEVIYLEEVIQAQLVRIERERYNLLQQKLAQLIEERLLAQEAKRRGMTVEQLLNEEVYAKAPKVAEDEITKFISTRQAQPSQANQTELRRKTSDYLRSQKLSQQRQDYVQRLREKAKVAVYLEEPASARVQVNSQKGFTRGPKNAPVAIVQFSDFQCPFCKALCLQSMRS